MWPIPGQTATIHGLLSRICWFTGSVPFVGGVSRRRLDDVDYCIGVWRRLLQWIPRTFNASTLVPPTLREPQQGVAFLPRTKDHGRLAGQMAGAKLGLDPFDAAVVHIGPALGDDPPGLALVLAQARFDQGVDDRQAGPGQPLPRQFLAGHVGEDAGQLGVGQARLISAPKKISVARWAVRRPSVAVDQPGQLGGQPPLGRAPAGVGLVLGQQRLRFLRCPGR